MRKTFKSKIEIRIKFAFWSNGMNRNKSFRLIFFAVLFLVFTFFLKKKQNCRLSFEKQHVEMNK